MGVILNPYSTKKFNTVAHLHDAIKEANKKQAFLSLTQLLNIFRKHSVHREFGLMIVHRHFELKYEEILVESMTPDKKLSVALPWKMTGNFAAPSDEEYYESFGMQQHSDLRIVPQSWSFSPKGTIEPFEFLIIETELANPTQQFLLELYETLKMKGLENVLGLRRIHLVVDTATWETTPDDIRANITLIGEQPYDIDLNDMVSVVWKASEDGMDKEGFCALCWCGTCGNCYGSKNSRQVHG